MSWQTASTRVGFIGVARVGLPMCAKLVRAGYDVTAGDVREELQAAVIACGARWGGPGLAVAAAVDLLITVLPGSAVTNRKTATVIHARFAGITASAFPACAHYGLAGFRRPPSL